MNNDISMKEFGITVKNGELKRNNRPVNTHKLLTDIMTKYKTIHYQRAEEIIEEWTHEAESGELIDLNDYIRQHVQDSKILDDFIIVYNTTSPDTKPLLHYKEGNKVKLISALPVAKKDMLTALQTYKPEEFEQLKETLAPIIRPKLSVTLDDEALVQAILSADNFFTTKSRNFEISKPIKPITLNNKELAYHSINYTFTDQPKLNPYLREFLSRVDSPEQLCAILWLMFNGIKTPYLVYLHGGGGEGKSSFINMLGRMVKYVGAVELDGNHKYYHMYGKALLTLTENMDTFLLKNKLIKEITGNSLVSCQEKNMASFTASLEGLLIVDSNNKLKLSGEEYEFRRLRYFEIMQSDSKEKLSAENYIKELGSTPDDFISYCKICYDLVGKNDQVEPSTDMSRKARTLVDSYYTYKFDKAISSMGLHIGGSIKVDKFYDIYDKTVKQKHSDKYFLQNFLDYLRVYHDVFEKNGMFNGITLEQLKHTTEVFND